MVAPPVGEEKTEKGRVKSARRALTLTRGRRRRGGAVGGPLDVGEPGLRLAAEVGGIAPPEGAGGAGPIVEGGTFPIAVVDRSIVAVVPAVVGDIAIRAVVARSVGRT